MPGSVTGVHAIAIITDDCLEKDQQKGWNSRTRTDGIVYVITAERLSVAGGGRVTNDVNSGAFAANSNEDGRITNNLNVVLGDSVCNGGVRCKTRFVAAHEVGLAL